MTTWEYVIVELPSFEAPTLPPTRPAPPPQFKRSTTKAWGWEAVGLTPLVGGKIAVLLQKTPAAVARAAGPGRRRSRRIGSRGAGSG
jgi:hypothetical protein